MTERQGYFDKRSAVLALFSLALIAHAFKGAFTELYGAWQTDEYSHGIIVPFIALLIAWHRLTELKPVLKPSWSGALLFVAAGGLLLTGTLAAFAAASEYGLILAIIALSFSFLGRKASRVMLPAFVYLLFAVPLPHIIHSTLSQDLQLISSTLGVWCLDLFGIPVFQEGNVIDLGGYKLQVAEACSGLRYLFPLMSFGYLVAYLLLDRLWKRAFVFFSVIPIAIAMNSLRIAFVGITVDRWGAGMAEGLLHEFEGWVVFLLCVALLMAEVFVLLRVGSRGRFRFEYLGPAHGTIAQGRSVFRISMAVFVAATLALATLSGMNVMDQRAEVEPAHPPFFTFPLTFGPWHGRQQYLSPEILSGLELSDYWLADYTRGDDKTFVNFYIAYYSKQRVGSEAHSPSNCIPGGGWKIESERVRTITLGSGARLSVDRLLISRSGVTQLVYYWFDERGRDITDTYRAKWYLLKDALLLHRTDGGLVRLVTALNGGESEAAAQNRLDGFLGNVYLKLEQFIPDGALTGNMLVPRHDAGPLSAPLEGQPK